MAQVNPNATSLGQRYLDRYAAGELTYQQLQSVLARGLITQEEFDAAVAERPPA